jgi:hypothetical protein
MEETIGLTREEILQKTGMRPGSFAYYLFRAEVKSLGKKKSKKLSYYYPEDCIEKILAVMKKK